LPARPTPPAGGAPERRLSIRSPPALPGPRPRPGRPSFPTARPRLPRVPEASAAPSAPPDPSGAAVAPSPPCRSALQASGIHCAGTKYMYVKSADNQVYGKKGATGIIAFKGATFVIVAVHGEGTQTGSAMSIVGKIGDYLVEQGM